MKRTSMPYTDINSLHFQRFATQCLLPTKFSFREAGITHPFNVGSGRRCIVLYSHRSQTFESVGHQDIYSLPWSTDFIITVWCEESQ